MQYRPLLLAGLMGCAGCSPALDWREVQPDGTGLSVLFPCRPISQTRQVRLAGVQARTTLHACNASGATWAVTFADVHDPSRVNPALSELRAAAASNIGAGPPRYFESAVPGATPNPESGRVLLSGTYPDGRSAQMQVAVFARGTVVFQASALGERLSPDALETFYSALRFVQ